MADPQTAKPEQTSTQLKLAALREAHRRLVKRMDLLEELLYRWTPAIVKCDVCGRPATYSVSIADWNRLALAGKRGVAAVCDGCRPELRAGDLPQGPLIRELAQQRGCDG